MLCSARWLLDPALGRIELRAAERVQLLAAFPQLQRLVERRLASFEPLDDLLEFRLGLLEFPLGGIGHGVSSSTRAPKPPSASVTSTRSSSETSSADAATLPDSVRTI